MSDLNRSGMESMLTKKYKYMKASTGYLKARISQPSGKIEISITSALGEEKKATLLEVKKYKWQEKKVSLAGRERETLQIHRLCMTGLRRETPTYPKNKKNVNCISARRIDIALIFMKP
jgi:hypothetical protein